MEESGSRHRNRFDLGAQDQGVLARAKRILRSMSSSGDGNERAMSPSEGNEMVDVISPSSSGESAGRRQLEADLLSVDCQHFDDAYRQVIAEGKRAAASLSASSGASNARAAAKPRASAEKAPERAMGPGLERNGSSESFGEEEEMDPSVPFIWAWHSPVPGMEPLGADLEQRPGSVFSSTT